MEVGEVLGEVLGVWTEVYLNGDASGIEISYDSFDFVGVFVCDLGGAGCVNVFLDVGGDGTEDEGSGNPSGFYFLACLVFNSSFSFLIFYNFLPAEFV